MAFLRESLNNIWFFVRFSSIEGPNTIRDRLLTALIATGTIFSALAFIPGVFLAFQKERWLLLFLNSVVLSSGLCLLLLRKLTYVIRATVALGLIYMVGVYVILYFGFLSGGPVWLFTFGVMSGLLFGLKGAVVGVSVNCLTLTVLGVMSFYGYGREGLPFFSNPLLMLAALGNFILTNAAAAVSCAMLIRGEQAVSRSLSKEKTEIMEAKQKLEAEVHYRKEAEGKQKAYATELEFLYETAMDLVGSSDEDALYKMICRRIKEITGDAVVLVNAFESGSRQFQTVALEGLGKGAERVLSLLGRHPVGMITTLNDEAAEQILKTGRLEKGPRDLHELSFGAVPKPVASAIERILGTREIYVIGFSREESLLGSAIIVGREGERPGSPPGDPKLIEAFVNQASVALQRNRFERELKASEERYRHLINHAPAGIYEIDFKNYGIASVNEVMCDYTGYTRDEFLALDPAEILAEESRQGFFERGRKIFLGKNIPKTTEYRIRCKDGHEFWARWHSRVTYEDGQPARTTVIVHDLSEIKESEEERKKLEQRLQVARQMEAIATLAGGVAHQFNNALGVITMGLDVIEMGLSADEVPEYLARIRASAEKMSGLTAQLLAYARGGKYQPKAIPMAEFLKTSLPLMEHTVRSSIRLVQDIPEHLPSVRVDVVQIQMVISAVLSNASEAIEGAGVIQVACTHEDVSGEQWHEATDVMPGPYVCLSISDNGKGMSEETRARIFDPFFTTKFQGRGLGMAAAYGIVRNHGGFISIDSTLDKGSTVRIWLPSIQEPPIQKTDRAAATDLAKKTILVVEDERMISEMIGVFLERLGHTVLTAETGKEAVNSSQSFGGPIDLVLLDILLPDMNGQAVYSVIKEFRPDTKVIVMSGYSQDGPAQEILDQGAQDFLQKPFTMKELSEKLRSVLGF